MLFVVSCILRCISYFSDSVINDIAKKKKNLGEKGFALASGPIILNLAS